ncbi:choice-of-anchor L domain-containing protein [Psychroflexus sp. S27]|uniref:choice-of-anchor L domain-containing protein n=1 Tax=Psychroflexus sp. S27 TaxID=1982757 RepID=UPI0018645D89|nr:choice-of-anchor L domain-containing protein [Psychroflexus sp. S27]
MKNLLFTFLILTSLSVFSQEIIMTDSETTFTDTGTFYDSGGPDSGIEAVTSVHTICPETNGTLIVAKFQEFLIGAASLKIYDGDTNTSPLIGVYNGINLEGVNEELVSMTASDANPTGCLTFEFSSIDANPIYTGWIADISTREPCQSYNMGINTGFDNTGSVAVGEQLDFFADVTPSSGIYDNLTYTWDFGDGTPNQEGANVSHGFNSIGTFTVTLAVEDEFGCAGTPFTINVTTEARYISVEAGFPYNNYSASTQFDVVTPNTGREVTIDSTSALVRDILVDNDCANLDNITFSGNTSAASIGYFNRNNSGFGIDEGIVITTGVAANSPGPHNGTLSDGSWAGDSDLENVIPDLTSKDASILEFDFVAASTTLNFDFVFASEEYGFYQCDYSDSFAFLLTNLDTGETQNIAIVPGTNDPISVTTIRDQAHNGSCNSQNVEYFDAYYGSGGDGVADPIAYRGYTVVMTAEADLVPETEYHIKMVIADRGDNNFDSAIFLSAGTFDFGTLDLGDDILLGSEEAACEGETITLDVSSTIDLPDDVEIKWFKDDELIAGESGFTLDVSDPGLYGVSYDLGNCELTAEILVEFYPTPIPEPAPIDLTQCEGNPFDLTINSPNMIDPGDDLSDFQIKYFTTLEDAENNTNPITNPDNFTFQGTTMPIFARAEGFVLNQLTGCIEIAEFQITYQDLEISDELTNLRQCNDYSVPVYFDLTNIEIPENLNGQNPNNLVFKYFLTQDDAEAGTSPISGNPTNNDVENYEATEDTEIFVSVLDPSTVGCFDTGSFILKVDNVRIGDLTTTDVIEECQDPNTGTTVFDLSVKTNPALDGQDANDYSVYYYSSEDAALINNAESAINDIQAYTISDLGQKTIYVNVVNDENTSCFETSSFLIEAFETPLVENTIDLEECGDFSLTQTFDLTQNESEVVGSQTGNYQVSYYLTEADAAAGNNSLTSAGEDVTAYSPINATQDIFIRIENSDLASCYSIGSFQIIIHDVEVAAVHALESCIDPVSGVANYDLTSAQDISLGNNQSLDSHQVNYYNQAGDLINTPEDYDINVEESITIEILNSNNTTCTATSSFELLITPQPTVSVAPTLEVCIDFENDANSQVDLTVQDAFINADGTGDVVAYYATAADFNNENPIQNPDAYTLNASQTEVFAAVINTASSCRSEMTSFALDNVIPLVDISDSDGKSVCIDENGDLVITETSPPVIETGMSEVDFDFEWLLDGQLIPGETSSNITAETPGEYTVIVSNALSGIACENTSTATILESGQIDFELNILTDAFQNNEHAIGVIITDIGLGDYEFRLDYGDWFDLEEGQTEIIFNNVVGGEHTVTARDKFGCGLEKKTITLIDFPEFFTPNEDGYNDTWNITNFDQPDAEIIIYDRYGKHIYTMTSSDTGWDGRYQGELLPSNDYWFTITYIEPRTEQTKTFKSHFTLKR